MPADVAWRVAGAVGEHSLTDAHRQWARAFMHVRVGKQCPSPLVCSPAKRRLLD